MLENEIAGWRAASDGWHEVRAASSYKRYPPDLINFRSPSPDLKQYFYSEIAKGTVQTPAEDIYQLRDAVVSDPGYVYLADGSIFAPSLRDQTQALSLEQMAAYGAPEIPVLEGPAAYIFKAGKDNYGHVLTEILPKLENLAAFHHGPLTLIVPSLTAGMRQILQDVVEALYDGRYALYQMQHPLLRVKHLLYPGPVSRHNLQKSATTLDLLNRLKRAFGGDPEPARSRRLYVSRERVDKRSMLNEAAVREFFQANGFSVVHPETLPFREQVRLFSSASAVAGPLGAAMTNAAFAGAGAEVMLLDPGLYDFFFYDLSCLCEQRMTWAFAKPCELTTEASVHQDFEFPLSVARLLV